MPIDFLVNYAWVIWLALILVFLVIEIFTLDFTFLMLAVGSAGGLVASFLPIPFWLQVIIVAVLAVLLIFAVRPPLLRRLRHGEDPTLSNLDALIGMGGTVATDFVDGSGYVKLANGETWTSRLSPISEGATLESGHKVSVISIDGATAVVAPVERIAL
ncbi:NfeD family protein [Glaciihabitans arcticus]|uniref:NfeD family protein n=1 Tax=Glaciihabitans arcticus TaxID=2668039 RepID=A0A4Q9GPC0_9MICO|nr:NfeD family protein [Glaciihabitans arcticus]TBN56596.1 NfeD family protein [Glaciihabitans arcticus]